MNFILSQLIAVGLFLLAWKLKELINDQNTYVKLLEEKDSSKFKNKRYSKF